MTLAQQSQVTHSPEECGLCRRIADGFKTTRNGVEISPLCEVCQTHHFANTPCSTAGLPKSTCARCRRNKRAVEHIVQAFLRNRKRYAAYCADCFEELGYVRMTQLVRDQDGEWEMAWWERPLTDEQRQQLRASQPADPFEGLR